MVIAEIGSNHDGSLKRAKKLIKLAAECGVDACKFQLIDLFRREWINPLIKECEKNKVEFMATPFSISGIRALKGKVKHWKISSTEGVDKKFVTEVLLAAEKDLVFISDGALEDFIYWGSSNIVPMACVVKYPAKVEDYHFIEYPVWGISDHTTSKMLPALAVAAGASVVEKHFTDDNKRKGPDHSFAVMPEQMKDIVDSIRIVEKIKNNKKTTITDYVGRKIEWP